MLGSVVLLRGTELGSVVLLHRHCDMAWYCCAGLTGTVARY